jgi:hypothetical protein
MNAFRRVLILAALAIALSPWLNAIAFAGDSLKSRGF